MAKARTSTGKALLASAMLGFTRAAQLAPQDESLFDPVGIEWSVADQQRPRLELPPSYTGRLSDLSSRHLLGTGDLLRDYSGRLFPSGTEYAYATLLNSALPLRSAIFNAYELSALDAAGRPLDGNLSASDQILLPGTNSVVDVERIAGSNIRTLEVILRHFIDEVRKSPDLPQESARVIAETVEHRLDDLASMLQFEFSAIRQDISVLRHELRENQRAIAETVAHLGGKFDLKKIVKETPKRLVEDVVDEGVVAGAKAAAVVVIKLLAAAIVGT